MNVCVTMAPDTQRGGLLRRLMSSSSVQMNPISGGAASWRFAGGRLLGPWGVAVHGEEETVVQLMKRVRVALAPLIPGETSYLREATIDDGTRGRCSPHWGR
jgi:hypothetical protein